MKVNWRFHIHYQFYSIDMVCEKKTCVALSFYESEYKALVEEAIWLKTLFEELGFLE